MKKKRRSMVPVSPGKDVTLYIPADTPPEVIRYLNRLKAEGVFSQGIMDILIRHIVREEALGALSRMDDDGDEAEGAREAAAGRFDRDAEEGGFPPEPADEEDGFGPAAALPAAPAKAFSLDEIFRQAGRNAGKLRS
ncbi:hypothetical protein I8J29_21710 [Paenibacillus sp. MWE-103]|uniref:CopG family transcriptional regulator n=1 Tax=Paenibacillus artemisiicola TaxID=1172618 RepID=A0ABS3WEU3_9BACL|nr:hypothetical protein [Paenibacillus artemisiicola]MBO7746837.1 hypothetical protein [Paenibacillus artemisiicola]